MAITDAYADPDINLGNTLSAPDSQICNADQIKYWTSQTADVNGMLGGYPQVSRIDLRSSKNFIARVRRLSRIASSSLTSTSANAVSASNSASTTESSSRNSSKRLELAVDCGAGIGRITAGLLVDVAETVDIVEPVTKFTDVLRETHFKHDQGVIGDIFNCGLEAWTPTEGKRYDLIWNQWCLGYLTDKQTVEYLRRASKALAKHDGEDKIEGWIMVKENLSSDPFGEDILDDADSSVTRSDQKFKQLFEESGLKIVDMQTQKGFPKSLYAVKMYALRPKR